MIVLLDRPRFCDLARGSLFTIPSRPGFLFLKTARRSYVGDFDLLRAYCGVLGGRDVYWASDIDMRVELIGSVNDEQLVIKIYDAQMFELTDTHNLRGAYRENPRVEPTIINPNNEGESYE